MDETYIATLEDVFTDYASKNGLIMARRPISVTVRDGMPLDTDFTRTGLEEQMSIGERLVFKRNGKLLGPFTAKYVLSIDLVYKDKYETAEKIANTYGYNTKTFPPKGLSLKVYDNSAGECDVVNTVASSIAQLGYDFEITK